MLGKRCRVEYAPASHRLPFVEPHDEGVNWWALPETGGYHGGCETGTGVALAYLRHVRAELRERVPWPSHVLGLMLLALAGDASEARRGQIVGFAYELEDWIRRGVAADGARFDTMPEADIEARILQGLARRTPARQARPRASRPVARQAAASQARQPATPTIGRDRRARGRRPA